MEKSKHTGPLVFVIVAQVLICACRFVCGDLFGGLQDGVAAIIGLAAVHELTALPAVLYGLACTLGFVYDASTSFSKLVHSKLADAGVSKSTFAAVLQVAPVLALVLSAAGALLAIRLYRHVAGSEAGEFVPLTATTPGSAPFWPSPPSPPPPPLCCKKASRHQERQAPFQAIFGAPLPRPHFPKLQRSGNKGAEVRAPSATPSEDPGSVL